jgi:hypothetical protein
MQSWQERGFRRGLLQVRATPSEKGLAFESWYDSLTVDYTSPQGKVTPDTDGLVGGRWTGTILPQGQASLVDRPFMPPELAQVSDLSDEMVDFFPPLATVGLAIGAEWSDSLGLEVERLRDSTGGGERLFRFRWRITSHGGDTPARSRYHGPPSAGNRGRGSDGMESVARTHRLAARDPGQHPGRRIATWWNSDRGPHHTARDCAQDHRSGRV